MRGSPLPFGQATTLTLADIEELQAAIPDIEIWDPMQMIPEREVSYRNRDVFTRIVGESERAERVWNRGVVLGETLDRSSVASSARVALVGKRLAAELFDGADPIGEQITIAGVPFRVIGVLEEFGTDPHGMDRDHEIHVPITTIMRRLQNVDYIVGAKLLMKDPSQIESAATRVRELLRERHHLNAAEEDDFQIITPTQIRAMVASMGRVLNLFLPLAAAVAMLVGGVVVANLMLASIQERRAEIGLRRAVGARSRDIISQFLLETTMLTVSGGVLGVIVGVTAASVLASRMKLPSVISVEAVATGVVFSALVGLLAGVLPARRAAGLDPVKALR
jgi:putative ABC transport system permease protein